MGQAMTQIDQELDAAQKKYEETFDAWRKARAAEHLAREQWNTANLALREVIRRRQAGEVVRRVSTTTAK
jgi:hypothetical protein